TIAGGAGNDTIQMTAAATLTDAGFLHATNIETLGLTGASTTTLGANAASAVIVNVITGAGATSITDSNGVTLNVDATALANNTRSEERRVGKEPRTGVQRDHKETRVSGALTVTTVEATSGLSIGTVRGTKPTPALTLT